MFLVATVPRGFYLGIIYNINSRRVLMERLILTCSCFNMGKKASEAFSALRPNEVLPPIVKGRDRIYKLGQKLGSDHIKAISKLTGRFAYYIEMDNDTIVLEQNLLTGARTK